MTQKRIVSISVVAALGLLSPFASWAFGLGQIDVKSALNQPFNAEIPVSSLRATERGNLEVSLASLSDFDRAGIERSLLLTQLRFEVIELGESALIKITSQVPIKEPFLDFLITASAGEGRMLREYTVLLDPPADIYQRPSQRAVTTPVPSASRPFTTTPTPSRPTFSADNYQVRRGDTLWQIAQQTKPAADISAQQMMMALLAANPDAFQRNNINGLRANVTLQIPDSAAIRRLSAAEANAAVNQQTQIWQSRNQSVAAAPQVATPVAPQAVTETTSDDVESAVSDSATTEANVADESDSAQQTADDSSRLQLVAAADEGDAEADATQLGDPDVEQLTEQLTLAQETIEAQTQENIDFKERMDAMEEQLETMRRLLSLKDEDMARLQAMLESDAGADAASPSLAELNINEPSSPDDALQNPENDRSIDERVAAMVDDQDKPAAANYLDSAKAFVSDFLMEILLGVLLFLLLIWLIVRHRRQDQTWDEAIGEIAEDDEKQSDMDEADSNAMVAPEVTEIETTPEPGKTVAELVDQADMFVGYADYVQARAALEQALQKVPNDKQVAAKLLFVLFKQNKVNEFNQVLRDSKINAQDSQWPDIQGWGLALMPNDGRFKVQPTSANELVVDSEILSDEKVFDLPAESETPAATVVEEVNTTVEFDISKYQSQDDITPEISIDEVSATDVDEKANIYIERPGSMQLDEKVNTEDFAPIQLDIDEDNSSDIDWPTTETKQPPLDKDLEPISLDFDDDAAAPESYSEAEKIAMQELEVGNAEDDLDFDLSGFDEVDEAETKLDLATAYVDMGDPDGARGILQEVLKEGTDEQKQRAQSLLESLT